MAINEQAFMNRIRQGVGIAKDTITGAGETLRNYGSAIKSEFATERMKNELERKQKEKAKKLFPLLPSIKKYQIKTVQPLPKIDINK